MESQTKKDKKHQRINPDGPNLIKRRSRKRENWIEGNYKRSSVNFPGMKDMRVQIARIQQMLGSVNEKGPRLRQYHENSEHWE